MAQPKPFDRMSGNDYRPLNKNDEGPVLNPVESRQGVISGRVLTILRVSLVLAAIAAAVLYAWPWGSSVS
jgi:hypothetical protein